MARAARWMWLWFLVATPIPGLPRVIPETTPRLSKQDNAPSSWSRARLRQLDPAYLTFPDQLQKVEAMGLIYKERPLFNFTLRQMDDRDNFNFYCPETLYETLDFRRTPIRIVHRKCDDSKLLRVHHKCLTPDDSPHSLLCTDLFAYRKVKVSGSWMFQKVFHGCGCYATAGL